MIFIWVVCGLIFTACQPEAPVSPTASLPLTPEATLSPWISADEGQDSFYIRGRCVHRRAISSIYPSQSGGLRDVNPAQVWIGTAVGVFSLLSVNEYSSAAAREYNMVVPENALKFVIVHPEPDRFDFCQMDIILDFARANQMGVRGTPLVWEQQLPEWVSTLELTQDEWRLFLKDHITRIVARYAGLIDEWDVVNEPLDEEGNFKKTLWYQKLGPDYIELALRWAHEANPNATLFINEFATENLNPKSDTLYILAQELLARGVPLHGIGFQMHLFEVAPPDPEQVAENFRRFNALGLEVAITEMDVRVLKPATPETLEHEAEIYQDMLEACLSASNCDTFVMWGVADRNSWIKYYYPDFEAPLILDWEYQPKPAYWALMEALHP